MPTDIAERLGVFTVEYIPSKLLQDMEELDMARTRVARGAAWLDAMLPSWASQINVETLSLRSINDCILGQLLPSLADGAHALRTWCFKYAPEFNQLELTTLIIIFGFDAGYSYPLVQYYALLDDLWIGEIMQRRTVESDNALRNQGDIHRLA